MKDDKIKNLKKDIKEAIARAIDDFGGTIRVKELDDLTNDFVNRIDSRVDAILLAQEAAV